MQSLKESILNKSVDLNQTLGVLAWPAWVDDRIIKMQHPSTNRAINRLRAEVADQTHLSRMDQDSYEIFMAIMLFISLTAKTKLGAELRRPRVLTNFEIRSSYNSGLSPQYLGFNGMIRLEFIGEQVALMNELEKITVPGWTITFDDGFNFDLDKGWRYNIKFKRNQ